MDQSKPKQGVNPKIARWMYMYNTSIARPPSSTMAHQSGEKKTQLT